ncbi:MAG: sortase [bacterium]|nr:sortase [bacterium]
MTFPQSGLIYTYEGTTQVPTHALLPEEAHERLVIPGKKAQKRYKTRTIGTALLAISLGGLVAPFTPSLRLESKYVLTQAKREVTERVDPPKLLPPAVPVLFDPLATPDGASIDPVSQEFSIIIPKIGVNAPVIEGVDPGNPGVYLEALKTSVAHAKTSFLPGEDGTTYLFSHSTNYDWFVKDLNAVFYLLKNLEKDDLVVIYFRGSRFTYRLTEKKIVNPADISYLVPNVGKKNLILQTCWPVGSTAERLLIFADLVEEKAETI